jgi:hypothetical protein
MRWSWLSFLIWCLGVAVALWVSDYGEVVHLGETTCSKIGVYPGCEAREFR